MVVYDIVYTKKAIQDISKLKGSGLDSKAKELVAIIKASPYQSPPPFERLRGDLEGACFRRINIQHRLVYEVLEMERVVKILSMWSHYDF